MATLIFDIDGVLVDSSLITVKIITELLEPFEELVVSPEIINNTFGMSMADMWESLMPGIDVKIQKVISDRYDEEIVRNLKGVSVLLPGVLETLSVLRERGHILTTASNCGILYFNAILDTQGLRSYLTDPQCLESISGYGKEDILCYHLSKNYGDEIYMIGDRASDLKAAQACGIPMIGCFSAFTKQGELKDAWKTVKNLHELIQYL